MSDGVKQNVDTGSAEFTEGVEAGLNSTQNTQNWQAGNEVDQKLKDEDKNKEPVHERLFRGPSTPLFMRYNPGSSKGNAQDEKDEAAE